MAPAKGAHPKGTRAGRIIFILAGLFAVCVGAWQGMQTWRFVDHAVAVTGHVIAVPGQSGRVGSPHPMIAFNGPGGSIIHYRQKGMGALPTGAPVELLYDPALPADTAVAKGFWTLWFPVLAPMVLGLAFLAVAALGVELGRRAARP